MEDDEFYMMKAVVTSVTTIVAIMLSKCIGLDGYVFRAIRRHQHSPLLSRLDTEYILNLEPFV